MIRTKANNPIDYRLHDCAEHRCLKKKKCESLSTRCAFDLLCAFVLNWLKVERKTNSLRTQYELKRQTDQQDKQSDVASKSLLGVCPFTLQIQNWQTHSTRLSSSPDVNRFCVVTIEQIYTSLVFSQSFDRCKPKVGCATAHSSHIYSETDFWKEIDFIQDFESNTQRLRRTWHAV